MDVRYAFNGIDFVWNAEKARTNQSRCNISFEQAAQAFFDPLLRVVDASDQGKTRDAIIAMDEHWQVLFVVHILLEDDVVLIISARRAEPNERRFYES